MRLPLPGFARRLLRRRWVQVYLGLLLLSHLVIAIFAPDFWVGSHLPPPSGSTQTVVEVPAMRDAGPVDGKRTRIALLTWGEEHAGEEPPLVLLHGSPSQGARDFRVFGPRLAESGRHVIAIDRPGFGNSDGWVPSYSILADARTVLAVLDELGVERAHLVGWSLRGGIVLHMADLAPERCASITLLGAIGLQEGEGSGSYAFEHVKYGLGYVGLVLLPELVPHFNLIGDRKVRHAFIRDFWDTDQRPLEHIIDELDVPTLILHGRDDPLVPAWLAEEHHRRIGPSRLVMLDASHFFPIGEPMDSAESLERGADALLAFCERHDDPEATVLRGVADFAPVDESDATEIAGLRFEPTTSWWIVVLLVIVGTFISEDLTVIAVGLLVVTGRMDWGVALVGCFLGIAIGDYGLWLLGRFAGRRLLRVRFVQRILSDRALEHWAHVLERHTAKAVFLSRALPGTRLPMYVAAGVLAKRSGRFLFWVTIAVAIWTPLLLVLTMLVGRPLLEFFEGIFHGPWAIIAAFAALFVALRVLSLEATDLGRQRLKAGLARFRAPEFWTPKLFYLPLLPVIAWFALRHRSPLVFTCANPGVPNGGGVVGESKTRILEGLAAGGAPILPAVRIPEAETPAQRVAMVEAAFARPDGPAGYPIVLKPEVGQRGFGVDIVQDAAEAERYFEQMPREAQAQAYDPGPSEYGILWARDPDATGPMDERAGFVFSITCKTFPVLVGDGERTIEELVWHHQRFRMQARAFLERFGGDVDRVPEDGEAVVLGRSGNHVQGAMFTDGAHLVTPQLEAWTERVAQGFRDPETGGRFDFGRFDVRCDSEADLRAGRDIRIIELNGTSSESTNLYDPERSIRWMYGVLFRQWSLLYRLGAVRRAEGGRPLTLAGLVGQLRRYYGKRRGRAVSD